MNTERFTSKDLLRVAVAWFCMISAFAADPRKDALEFDPAGFTILNITVDGAPMQVRRYHVTYVANPIKITSAQSMGGGPKSPPGGPAKIDPYGYQSMYIYVPKSAYNDTKTAIILQVTNFGWFASAASDSVVDGGVYVSTSNTDSAGAALKAGYIVINAGTRSRGVRDEGGNWVGKAPAVVVDAKAAIRYLRFNDAVMPGSAERIVITGTSGGGGLSVAVAASGNSPDYNPYLAEIGAAGIDANGKSTIRDDVFATVAYCPITDLGHADIAYEWQYNAVRTDRNTARGQYPASMRNASAALAAEYPAYLMSLDLKLKDGTPLTADSMDDAIVALVKKEAEEAISKGTAIPAIGENFVLTGGRGGTSNLRNDWLAVENGKVKWIDYKNYLRFVAGATALKTVPAFDATANTGNKALSGENSLFGPINTEYSNFMKYAWDNNEVPGDNSGFDDTGKKWTEYIADPATTLDDQIRMVSPMAYLNSAADTAPYWYVRHGMVDRDTSFAVEAALYYAILNDPSVKDVNFKLAWLRPHSGNYDVQEAYAWIAGIIANAGDRGI
jgi:hypothetical protein